MSHETTSPETFTEESRTLEDVMRDVNEMYRDTTPTPEEFAELRREAADAISLVGTDSGNWLNDDDTPVDADVVVSFLENADPATWILSGRREHEDRKLADLPDTEKYSAIPKAQRQLIRDISDAMGITLEQAAAYEQQQAKDRLILSDALKAEAAQSETAKLPEPKTADTQPAPETPKSQESGEPAPKPRNRAHDVPKTRTEPRPRRKPSTGETRDDDENIKPEDDPTQAPTLKDIKNSYYQAFQKRLDGGKSMTGKKFSARLDDIANTLEDAFMARAASRGQDPNSDEVQTAYEAYVAKMDEKLTRMYNKANGDSGDDPSDPDLSTYDNETLDARIYELVQDLKRRAAATAEGRSRSEGGELRTSEYIDAVEQIERYNRQLSQNRGIDPDSPAYEGISQVDIGNDIDAAAETLNDHNDEMVAARAERDEAYLASLEMPRSRVRRAMAAAREALSHPIQAIRGASKRVGDTIAIGMAKTGEYFGDEEKGRRRKIVAGVVGAFAVGAAAYGVFKWGESVGFHEATQHTPKGAGTVPKPPAHVPALPKPESVTVQPGDNVWDIVSKADGHNNHLTAQLIDSGQVHAVNAHGVVDSNLNIIHPGDTVSFTLPSNGSAGAVAQHVATANTGAGAAVNHAASVNTEILTPFNEQTGAGTVSYATLEHLHHLNLETTNSSQLEALTNQVAQFNHLSPQQLRDLPVGRVINFPPQVEFEQWLQHLKDLDATSVSAS